MNLRSIAAKHANEVVDYEEQLLDSALPDVWVLLADSSCEVADG